MILIKNGRIFDGSKNASFIGSLLVKDGRVAKTFRDGEVLPELAVAGDTIDAAGCWVTPGFIDSHTHYDFEVLVNPALTESVRHGVTTVITGSCSISAIMADYEDCSDIFTRVEGVPRDKVLPVMKQQKTWSRPKQFVEHLGQLPLGANVASYIGHSDIRMAAMGIEKSVSENSVPSEQEQRFMEDALQEALDAGFVGMSSMQSDADRLDGDRVRSKALPSVYASFKEYAALNKVLRKSKRVLQTAPDVRNPMKSMLHLGKELMSLFRNQLRVTSIVMMDAKGGRKSNLRGAQSLFSNLIKLFRGNFRWQTLPCEFHIRITGMNFVIFEEVPAGASYLHLMENTDRDKLVQDPEFKAEFIKNLTGNYQVALWNRDIGDGEIFECPDKSLVGLKFAEIAKQRNEHVAGVFVDLLAQYGNLLVWKLVMGNERDEVLAELLEDKRSNNIISFSDAGAHIQNMAFYNFPLQMLARLQKMRAQGIKTISDDHAVYRLTGEVANWHGIDAGCIKTGSRADINIIDPEKLALSLDSVETAGFDGIEDFTRLVNRNDSVVKHVLINGKVAVSDDQYHEQLGQSMDYGSFLKAH